MTQEFEEFKERVKIQSGGDKEFVESVAYAAWQASREQLKAKLLSDEMVEVAAVSSFADMA